MKKYFLFLGLLFIFSCKKEDAPYAGFAMYFEKPQPIDDSELSKIPSKFRGIFINSDSVYIDIKENVILKESYSKFRFHKSELDSIKAGFDLKGNQYVSKLNNDVFDYRYLGDSIEFSSKQIDTFFVFSDTQKAKRIDGQLVLNYKDSIYWDIKAIRLEKNMLKIKYIYSEEDLKRIDSLTKVKSTMIDSSSSLLRPSRNEFKRILNLKKLGESREYKKVKNN
nr:hypothetical protein [uncultured Flavobacterium sp.]